MYASNRPPIILMHGFMGWGRDEMNNYYYWGGTTDLEEFLSSHDLSHQVFVLLDLVQGMDVC